jgi:hypothetical protein
MDITRKGEGAENREQTYQERKPEVPASATEGKRSLNLRHQTAFAWVMPETWEPLRN